MKHRHLRNSPHFSVSQSKLFKASTLLALGTLFCGKLGATSVLTYSPLTASSMATGPYTIGSYFQVNVSGLSVTQLGVMDTTNLGTLGSDGFVASGPVSVGLWSWDGSTATLLAQAAVNDTDTLINGYRYVDLGSAVNLTAGQKYLLGAYVGSGIEWFLDAGNNTNIISASSSDFTLLGNRYATGGSLAAPTADGTLGVGRWGAANATISAVPEPSTYGLMGAGALAGAAFVRRRRRHAGKVVA